MTVLESLPAAFFCITMVFIVLACLFILIKLFSAGVRIFESKDKEDMDSLRINTSVDIAEDDTGFSSGELKLYNVDERTAAMIMAIVSDESGIPLTELRFKSIRALGQKSDR